MRLRNIILHSTIGNISVFKGYFIATSFSVVVYFMMSMLLNHPNVPLESLNLNFQKALEATNMVIFVFLSLFIIYSAYTYIKLRSKDYAMYKILGMRSYQLDLLHLGENFFIYITALIVGILTGLVLIKLFFLGIAKLFDLEPIPFYFPFRSIFQTFSLFGLLYLFISLFSFAILKRTEIKKVLQLGRTVQKPIRLNYLFVFISFALIIVGYILAFTANNKSLVERIIPITLMVIVGTFFFYHQICSFLLLLLKRKKSFYYKGVNSLWVSDLSYRIKDSSLVLFLTTIIMTVGLVILSTVYSTAYNTFLATHSTDKYPLVISSDSASGSTIVKDIKQHFEKEHIDYVHQGIQGRIIPVEKWKNTLLLPEGEVRRNFPSILKNVPHLLDQEVYRLKRNIVDPSIRYGEELENHLLEFDQIDERLFLKDSLPAKLFRSLYERDVLIVSDAFFNRSSRSLPTIVINVFDHEKASSCGKFLYLLRDKFNKENQEKGFYYISSYAARNYSYVYSIRFYLFLSITIAALFFISAGSMLYFKFFNHLNQEKMKYANFYKIGLSKKEVIQSSRIQMAILFFLPNLLAVSHTSFALKAFKNVASKDFSFSLPVLEVFFFTLLIQIIYFLFFNHKYNRNLLRSLDKKNNF